MRGLPTVGMLFVYLMGWPCHAPASADVPGALQIDAEQAGSQLESMDASWSHWLYDSEGLSLSIGADLLLIRPHFSEAVAFATGTQTATTYDVRGRPLAFDYQDGARAFVGIPLGAGELRLAYGNLNGDVSVDHGAPSAGQFVVDPFGNLVGTAIIIDPSDPRVGTPVTGGDFIRTHASVQLNSYDVQFLAEWHMDCWDLWWDLGARIADVHQFYSSTITLAGAPLTEGTFAAHFSGAGPRVGIGGTRYLAGGRLSLTASLHGALLLGDHQVDFSNVVTGVLAASQSNGQIRTIPVLESELGVTWHFGEASRLTFGWQFQAWHDLGTSGGNFGGFFAGADDANTMSFDGAVVRVEFRR